MSRNSQREIIAERIKLVHQLEAELDRIWKAKLALGFIELPKPIRDGWFKTFRLRDDIKRSKKATIYEEVLSAVAEEIWGQEKKYADKNWSKYFSRHRILYQHPGIKRLDEKEYNRLSSKAKKCFFKRRITNNSAPVFSCTIPIHYFVHTYKRAYIYKFKVVSAVLESRRQEILEILERSTLRPFSKYCNYNYRMHFNPAKRERRRIKIELSGCLTSDLQMVDR